MPLPAPKYSTETEEHVETATTTPAVKFDDTLQAEILSQIHEFFDQLEDIPQAGGFFVQNIKRNKSDVYHVVI
jgi:hypothetical protein